MRVLYFSSGYSPHDHRFLSALAETQHRVFYVQLQKPERELEGRAVPREIEQVVWAGGRRDFRWQDVPRLVADLKRVIAAVSPDLIHAGPVQTCAFIAVLSRFRPILTMSWGFDLMQDAERNAWWRWVTRYTLRRSTYFTSDAHVTRDRAVAYGMKPERIRVFPWGVDLKHFAPPRAGTEAKKSARSRVAKARAGAGGVTSNSESFVVLCNRSWEPRYGVDVLARAFVRAARRESALSLVLLGDGSQVLAIRGVLLDAGMLDRVQLRGYVAYADLLQWYRSADLFVSPSHVDGSSVSLMEALACGLPVLVSDIPANREWIQEGVNGWLFPDGDAEALAQKILAVAHRKRARQAVARAARRTAEERADWRKNFATLLEIYQATIQLG